MERILKYGTPKPGCIQAPEARAQQQLRDADVLGGKDAGQYRGGQDIHGDGDLAVLSDRNRLRV